jgi:hypothetical protein
MAYKLYVGHRSYFSWSLTAALLFDRFGLEDAVTTTILRPDAEDAVLALMTDLAPARTLPTVITADGAILNDTMAIAEELASRHPSAGFWPDSLVVRGTARALASEMHSSFGTLRGSCLSTCATPFNPSHPMPPSALNSTGYSSFDRMPAPRQHLTGHGCAAIILSLTLFSPRWPCGWRSMVSIRGPRQRPRSWPTLPIRPFAVSAQRVWPQAQRCPRLSMVARAAIG